MMPDTFDMLTALTKHTKFRYCEVSGGIVFHFATAVVIPDEHIVNDVLPEDGFYRISEMTCDNAKGCQIGAPSEDCISRNIVFPNRCARYAIHDWQSGQIFIDQAVAIAVDVSTS